MFSSNRLKSRVKFNDYIIPICLPKREDPNNGDLQSTLPNKYDFMSVEGVHIMGTVVGWGWLRDSHRNQGISCLLKLFVQKDIY